MGHVVFAAPSIARFHLHERLGRKLLSRGHVVEYLCPDPVSFRCHSAHGLAARLLAVGRGAPSRIPIAEFALQQCLLEGIRDPDPAELGRRARPLTLIASGLVRFFERNRPDLVFLHQERGGLHRLIHFVAREYGTRILWTGDGMLPGTQQIDGEGIDGDSSSCRRSAIDYRDLPRDPDFLESVLSAWIAQVLPPALARAPRHDPRLLVGLWDLVTSWRSGRLSLGKQALHAWRAEDPKQPSEPAPAGPTGAPFVVLVLQNPSSPRIRLDAPDAPDPALLARTTAAALKTIDPGLRLAIVLPSTPLPSGMRWSMPDGAQVLTSVHLPVLTSTAGAFVSVNDPSAVGALLAGTPVLHFGRTPYGVPGVARRTSLDTLREDLREALPTSAATLRERFLYRYLRRDHVWCSPDFPDQNGLRGLVLAIELALKERGQEGADLRYAPGPTWPLAQSRRLESS